MAIPFEELKASVSLSAIVGRSLPLKRSGREMKGLCPFHKERTPSFTVNDAEGFYHCFGCGAHGDVFDWLWHKQGIAAPEAAAFLGYRNGNGHAHMPDNDPWRPLTPPSGTLEPDLSGFDHIYRYTDPDGSTLRFIARKDATATTRKQFVPFTWGILDGRSGWHRRHAAPLRGLYGLGDLDEQPDAMVVVCEGEKAADAARAMLGLPCVTWSGGTAVVHQNDWRPLANRDVVIWPDNDEPGHKAAGEISALLVPLARTVRVLPVRDLPDKADAADLPPDTPETWFHGRLAKEDPSGGPIRIETLRRFMDTFVVPDYLVDGIIQRGRLYALTSPTGHGKTAVALYLGCMIASDRNIGGIEVSGARVLFLAGENSEDLCGRVHAAVQEYGLNPDTTALDVMPGNFPITPEAAELLRQQIDATGHSYGLIIGDSLAAYFPGDEENDNVQMGAYARNWRVLTGCNGNPAIIALAHPIKAATQDTLSPRGGGAFMAEIDGNLTLWAHGDRTTTTLYWQGKFRGADFQPVTFALKPVKLANMVDGKGRPFVSVIATLQTSEEAEKAGESLTTEENTVLEQLRRYPGISVTDIARNCGWVSDKGSPQKSKVHRLLISLKDEKLARMWRRKWLITDTGKAELARGEGGWNVAGTEQ
jgi:hypothetical protein